MPVFKIFEVCFFCVGIIFITPRLLVIGSLLVCKVKRSNKSV